jgi:hypothetical protein
MLKRLVGNDYFKFIDEVLDYSDEFLNFKVTNYIDNFNFIYLDRQSSSIKAGPFANDDYGNSLNNIEASNEDGSLELNKTIYTQLELLKLEMERITRTYLLL